MTATPSTSPKRDFISFSIRLLTRLLIIPPRVSGLGIRDPGERRSCSSPQSRFPSPETRLHGYRDLHRGGHRRLQHDLLEVRALARLRLELLHDVDHRVNVVRELLIVEAHLANNAVDIPTGVVAELDLAGRVFGNRLGDIR